jgi:hypothetical protein
VLVGTGVGVLVGTGVGVLVGTGVGVLVGTGVGVFSLAQLNIIIEIKIKVNLFIYIIVVQNLYNGPFLIYYILKLSCQSNYITYKT